MSDRVLQPPQPLVLPPQPPPPVLVNRVEPCIWKCIWKACAGENIRLPEVNSTVYYYPHAHLGRHLPLYLRARIQEACASSSSSAAGIDRTRVKCRVARVLFLANVETNQILTKIALQPLIDDYMITDPRSAIVEYNGVWRGENRADDSMTVYAKILSQSDSNSGGGFTVPVKCASAIFPKLPSENLQTLIMTDIHGERFSFRHVYSGRPLRHLLTSGWTPFVNRKKLKADDSAVFMRNERTRRLFIGTRQKSRPSESSQDKERLLAQVLESINTGTEFMITYYPVPGSPLDFLRAAADHDPRNNNSAPRRQLTLSLQSLRTAADSSCNNARSDQDRREDIRLIDFFAAGSSAGLSRGDIRTNGFFANSASGWSSGDEEMGDRREDIRTVDFFDEASSGGRWAGGEYLEACTRWQGVAAQVDTRLALGLPYYQQ